MPTKPCRRCRETRPLTDFYANSRAKGGREATCAPCRREQAKDARKGGSGYMRHALLCCVCGNAYVARHRQSKTCSARCKQDRRNQRQADRRQAEREVAAMRAELDDHEASVLIALEAAGVDWC